MLVRDYVRTGVSKPDWYSPVIIRTNHELAEYYNTPIIPARVKKPKDSPQAERTVGIISSWIIASLRKRQFFSLSELNQAIRALCHNNCHPVLSYLEVTHTEVQR